MSYYKYAERSSESRVDWNEISKGMVDMLKEQTRLRNDKLDAAVKLQGEVTTTLSDAPMGSDVNANQRVSQFASDAQEYSLMMNKLWRSGEMSYREYIGATNNFKTNTEGYLGQAEKYAANYEKHVQRMEEQIASGVEVSELARVEDFGNFNKFTPVIDAPTGSIGLVGEDGAKYASVSQLGVAVMSQYDRLDVEGRTTDVATQMGKTVNVIKSGGVRTLESALQNPNYVAAEDEAVSGILIGDNAHTSVLVDFKRGLYSTTHDINDAINDPNAVLMVPSSRNSDRMVGAVEDDAAFDRYIDEQATRDGQPLTDGEKATLRRHRDAQREQAFEAVRDQLRARLPFVETATADATPKPPSSEERKGAQRTVDVVNNIRKLHSLKPDESEEDVNAALSYIQQLNPNVRKIDLRDEEIVIRMKDGNLIPITKGDQADLFVESIINAVFKDRAVNLPDALNKAGVYDEGLTRHSFGAIAGLDETVGYDDEIEVGIEGVLKKSSPRAQYELRTGTVGQDDEGQDAVAAAATDALARMNFSGVDVEIIQDIDRPGWQFNFDTKQNLIKYFIPDVMPYQVFIPDTNSAGIVGQLIERADIARSENREITVEELQSILGPENYKNFNTQEMRNAYPTASAQVDNPNVTSGASSGGNAR